MALSDSAIAVRDLTSITLNDGTGTPLTMALTLKDSNFEYTETLPERIPVMDNSAIMGYVPGPDVPITFSYSVGATEFTNATANTLLDWIKGTNNLSAIATTGTGTAERGDLDLHEMVVVFAGTTHGDQANKTLTFADCAFTEYKFAQGDYARIEVTGTAIGVLVRAGISA
jgi:hypothetical protein